MNKFDLLVSSLLTESNCTKVTKKTHSDRKEKKWMKCVKNPNGKGYKKIHWGQAGVRVTGKSGNTKRKKSFIFYALRKVKICKKHLSFFLYDLNNFKLAK